VFRTILVAVDGSDIAERAVPYATRLASSANGSLVLTLAVVHNDDEEAQAYLVTLTDRLQGTGVPVEYELARGAPVDAILQVASTREASCIVMGTHGRTGLPELMVGSVAEAVLARSPGPVLLVNKHLPASAFPDFDPAHSSVLVPLDGSPFAETALAMAEELLATDGTLVLTRVVPSAEDVATWPDDTDLAYSDDPQRLLDAEGLDYLEEVADDLRRRRAERRLMLDLRRGWPAEQIAAAVREHGASLVVMAAHGRTGLRRLLLGSVASEVLRSAQSPLLLVHPPRDAYSRTSARSSRSVTSPPTASSAM
jgi:nucleotide-binding universal stress UspA family protein